MRTVLLVCASVWLVQAQPAPLLDPQDEAFFLDQARRVVDSAALNPGQFSGNWNNATRYRMHVPGGNMGYPAFWVRDAVMMLGADFITAQETEDWIRLMAGTVRPQDWHVRPGVVVPAFAMPDHINFDGKPTFYPGNYYSDDRQGGSPFGKYPPLDDHFYFIAAVHENWKLTGSLALFRSSIATGAGAMTLADFSERVFGVAPVDARTGLVVAGDVDTENAKDFGFCDSVFKSGKVLFASLLRFDAARRLAELYQASGDAPRAARFRREAVRIRKALVPAFYQASAHAGEGWLLSASGVGRQPDVWGSAYAIALGALDAKTADRVARALLRAYRERTAVRNGCVRHILTSDSHGGWERSASPPGEYQNGGYWGTATGWYIVALHRADGAAARAMARDYIAFLRTGLGPDGSAQAWEWFNPDTGKRNNPQYVATVALPYVTLLHAGLLRPERRAK
jgi:hypothetical protein